MIRWTIAGLIVVALLVGLWAVWPRDGGATSTTTPEATDTTTSSETATTTSELTTTTTVDPLTVRDVETVEQAEAILRELWFGWFEGIYNEDEDRIREVVANSHQVELANEQFGVMEFTRSPQRSDISFSDTEILRSDSECLALWSTITIEGFREGTSTDVYVLRWLEDGWRIQGLWAFREDRWEADCEAQLG
ncbi:MAG: hypothetical protein ACRDVL_10555 [Acidimicrobiia bacterium]